MRDILIPLIETSTRPIIRIQKRYNALIDTGAEIPLCQDATLLTENFGAKPILRVSGDTAPNGIGEGHVVSGTVYGVKSFELGELIYPNMRFLVPDEPAFSTHFLFSASMFFNLVLEIDFCKHYLKITIPDGQSNVRNVGYTKDGRLHILEVH